MDRRNCSAVEIPFIYRDDEKVELPWKYSVCDICSGHGSHVNPSVDSHGISAEEFAEDPGFREDYFSGVYDQVCNGCGGTRVIPVIDPENCSTDLVDEYCKQQAEEAEYNRMCAMERRYGA